MPRHSSRIVLGVLLIVVSGVAVGCGKRLQQVVAPLNQPPLVRLESASLPTGDPQTAAARLRWTAGEPDGRVDHFLVTQDPTTLDRESGWAATTERERTLRFRRAERGAMAPVASAPAFQFFAVRAVDDQGAVSAPAYRVFFGDNVAPTVRIVDPAPTTLIVPQVFTKVWVRWEGSDPDGPNGRPAKYKFRLFRRDSAAAWIAWAQDPDSLRRQFAPAFPGWDSLPGDSTRLLLQGLEANRDYLFAITAIDAEGGYDPVFSLTKNMLRMKVVGSVPGPVITFFNSEFQYTYPSGDFVLPAIIDSSRVVRIQAPTREPLTVNWYAETRAGTSVAGYRWALDIADLRDETPRRNRNDLAHWSAWSLATTSATVGPFHGPELDVPHRLYVEVKDDVGLASVGAVEFRMARLRPDRELLIVDDTRLQVDQLSKAQPPGRTDSLRAPFGPWPSAAELDTFLFAVGGKPWRMKTPWGRLSPTGIFAGYDFDTLGTRNGLADPTVSLELLGHYRHVVWITDRSDAYNLSPASATRPMATLVYMSGPGRQNTLATWVRQGGRLWALGGGFGHATNKLWNRTSNDSNGVRTYSALGQLPDLGPGRFMYDLAHWRSEFKAVGEGSYLIARAPFAPGGRHGVRRPSFLPVVLRAKSPATDPLWPNRPVIEIYPPSSCYFNICGTYVEYLSKPGAVIDDWNPAPWCARDVSALDTLMVATGPGLPAPGPDPAVDRVVNPVMTHYHGADCGPVVFSGFDCWSWTRADCVALVDAVLNGAWGLSRQPRER